MKRQMCVAVLIIVLLAALMPVSTRGQEEQRCFPETNQCIAGRIRQFWEQNGGLPIFGFPIGPQHEEQIEGRPYQVQQFERNRLELHPENAPPYDVLLGRLGVARLVQQKRDWFTFPKGQPQQGCLYFEITQHTICPPFLAYWQSNGLEINGIEGKTPDESLALFGLPISEPQPEQLSDGNTYIVQWFERARFEVHPENAPPYNILLGLLGNETSGTGPIVTPTTPPPPRERAKITLSQDDIAKLADILPKFGLSTQDVNVERTVGLTLPALAVSDPNADAVLMLVAPLRKPQGDPGVLGVLKASRSLPVSDNELPAGVYLLRLEHGELHFIANDGQEPIPPANVDEQSLMAKIDIPQAVITKDQICFRWDDHQACAEPSPANALTSDESNAIRDRMSQSVQALADKGLIDRSDINIDGTLTDPEGDAAVQHRQASLIAAPAARFPSDKGNVPVDGGLLGVFDVQLDVAVPGYPLVPKGIYTVRAVQTGRSGWMGQLESVDGQRIMIPAKYIPAQPRLQQPQVEIVNIQVLLCFFEC